MTDMFPDVHDQPLPFEEGEKTDSRNQATRDANALHDRVYAAVMHILASDFQFLGEHHPPSRDAFPGSLTDEEQALFLAVYGQLLADDWDPTSGKTQPGSDDTVIPKTNYFITRRFVDATVAAVQEYTSNAPLYRDVFHLLRGRAHEPARPAATH